MLGVTQDHKVFWPVVKRVLVDVMDMFIREKRAAKLSLHHEAMFRNDTITVPDISVSLDERGFATGSVSTGLSAKSPPSLSGQVVELDATKLADAPFARDHTLGAIRRGVARPRAVAISVSGRDGEGFAALSAHSLITHPSVVRPSAKSASWLGLNGTLAVQARLASIRVHSDRLLHRLIGVPRPGTLQRRPVFLLPELYQNSCT